MNILLASVGRRPYLIKWFKDALGDNAVSGTVFAADSDVHSPAKSFADKFLEAPNVGDSTYTDWLATALSDNAIDLAVSVNDFELSIWASLSDDDKWDPLLRLTSETQHLVEDKLLMADSLISSGINVPRTWLANDLQIDKSNNAKFVTKGRFGSGSRGLRFATTTSLNESIESALEEVTTASGELALDQEKVDPREFLIVQEEINGTEYGLDIVCDFKGDFAAVVARKKISMRDGETDRAVSVSSDQFEEVSRKIAKTIPHSGSIDVDIIVNESGKQYLIDVNPRLGGGYPFSHLAGARVPSAYVAWTLGTDIHDSWLHTTPGVIGGKFIEAVEIL